MKLYVLTTSTVCSFRESDNPYASWEENNDVSIQLVCLEKPEIEDYREDFDTFEVNYKVEPGDVVYVMYMDYDTGDSFGSAYNLKEILWVFNDEMVAHRAVRDVTRMKDEQSVAFEFDSDSEETILLSNPAWGYFEHVNTVDYKKMIVQ